MKKLISALLTIMCVIALAGGAKDSAQTPELPETPAANEKPFPVPEEPKKPRGLDDTMPTVNIQVGDKSFTAALYDNESARTIAQEMPFTLNMDDFASQEKVTKLSFDLPSASTVVPATINAGDIYLWSGSNLVLFYTTFSNTYSYVPIGHIMDVSGLRDALGSGSAEITFSIND